MSRHDRRGSVVSPSGSDDHRQRADAWLVYARFAKTRAAAVRLIESGHARLNGARLTEASRKIGPGDVLTLVLPHATRVVRVLGLPRRRGSFTEARIYYEDVALS